MEGGQAHPKDYLQHLKTAGKDATLSFWQLLAFGTKVESQAH